MSRNTVILLMVLCAAVAGLIVFSKIRSRESSITSQQPSRDGVANIDSQPAHTAPIKPIGRTANNANPNITISTSGQPSTIVPPATTQVIQTSAVAYTPPNIIAITNNEVPELKPLPVLEKDYATATNRDVRLDIMMDIAETPGPEAVKVLTRLFETETDADLKVDLLDSLLGIEGFKDEKLIMLTMGARQGLPSEVRQSAIDGLIDLDDPRVIPVLNGLLNDPDAEIREGAKDALEMIQSQPAVKLK